MNDFVIINDTVILFTQHPNFIYWVSFLFIISVILLFIRR